MFQCAIECAPPGGNDRELGRDQVLFFFLNEAKVLPISLIKRES
jgi:hypothetical protein